MGMETVIRSPLSYNIPIRRLCTSYLEVGDELVGAVGRDLDVLLADVEEREEEVE